MVSQAGRLSMQERLPSSDTAHDTDFQAGDLEHDPLKGINVDAAGGASKVLKMLAAKVRLPVSSLTISGDVWRVTVPSG